MITFPNRPPNRHERRRANAEYKRKLREIGLTRAEVVRRFDAKVQCMGAMPTSTLPSESLAFGGHPTLTPEECRALCRGAAGDPKRDRWGGFMVCDRPLPMHVPFDGEKLKPIPVVILEWLLRSEGNHRLADDLLACPPDQVPAAMYHGVDDVSIRYVGFMPMCPGGDA